jgi:hypothetical protein
MIQSIGAACQFAEPLVAIRQWSRYFPAGTRQQNFNPDAVGNYVI